MININNLITATLAPLGVPVSLRRYAGTAPTYITFFEYNEQGEEWAQNQETATGCYMQIDIWSKTDYTDLSAQVLAALIAVGFKRTMAIDLSFEPNTLMYHKVFRMTYVDF
jgi:hypothetical protein